MTLLTFDEIKQGLDQQFLPLEPMLTGLRLVDGGVLDEALDSCESQLSVAFPTSFRSTVKAFDFGKLTIGPIVFCNTGDYLRELKRVNTEITWWGNGGRPDNLLVVANSDPYAIFLNCEMDELFALDADIGWQKAKKIAKGFDNYVRGIATIMLRRTNMRDFVSLAQAVMSDVDGTDLAYWSQLAK
jgi:hypothetical protein